MRKTTMQMIITYYARVLQMILLLYQTKIRHFFVVLFIATINLCLYCVLQCEANNSIEIKRNNSLTRL